MQDFQKLFSKKLDKVYKVFDTQKVLKANTDVKAISKYYKINKIPYSIIYRGHDAIHLGITYGDIYDRKEDILEQARLVEKYIKKDTKNILELATGRGINSSYLAKKYPEINFLGIDLPGGHTHYAFKKAEGIKNFEVKEGDFHDLSSLAEKHFDVIFVVEAICYANNDKKVFNEVKRVLKDGGIFIAIDAFADKKNPTDDEKIVKSLIEKGMAVENFSYIDDFKNTAKETGFKVLEEKDLSRFVLPTLSRVEKYANWYFGFPIPLQKFFLKVFPPEFSNNALSGYFMKDSVDSGLYKYMEFVFQKA